MKNTEIALIVGGLIAVGVAAYEYLAANQASAQETAGSSPTVGPLSNLLGGYKPTSGNQAALQNPLSVQYSVGMVKQTNNGNVAIPIQGSGQTLNPGSSLVSIQNGPSYIATPASPGSSVNYITSLNTSAYGNAVGAPTTLNSSNTAVSNGIPDAPSGSVVQSTNTGFYKVTTPSGAVVYTNINPAG